VIQFKLARATLEAGISKKPRFACRVLSCGKHLALKEFAREASSGPSARTFAQLQAATVLHDALVRSREILADVAKVIAPVLALIRPWGRVYGHSFYRSR